MDAYALALEVLSSSRLTVAQAWPEIQGSFKRYASNKPREWNLPILACEAVGGRLEQAAPAVAAIACAQISIILIDDLLDDDPRGLHQTLGVGAAANLAAAFQAMALEVIGAEDGLSDPVARLAAYRSLNQMLLTTAFGQHLDIQNPADEAAYWRVAETKSSPLFGAALHLGALAGGASIEIAEKLKQLGGLYGEVIQIHDDLNDVMAVPASPDWVLGRTPLPILFAQTVDHPKRERFRELRRVLQAAPDPEALAEAQLILIRCGAVSYSIDQIVRRHQTVREMLNHLTLPHHAGLELWFDDLIKPVQRLFDSLGGA